MDRFHWCRGEDKHCVCMANVISGYRVEEYLRSIQSLESSPVSTEGFEGYWVGVNLLTLPALPQHYTVIALLLKIALCSHATQYWKGFLVSLRVAATSQGSCILTAEGLQQWYDSSEKGLLLFQVKISTHTLWGTHLNKVLSCNFNYMKWFKILAEDRRCLT